MDWNVTGHEVGDCSDWNDQLGFSNSCQPPCEQMKENLDLWPSLSKSQTEFDSVMTSCPRLIQHVTATADSMQEANLTKIESRWKDIMSFKGEEQALVEALRGEWSLLDDMRKRVMSAAAILELPETLNSECITRRCSRCAHDNVFDAVDHALGEEKNILKETRELLSSMIGEIDSQMKTVLVCKSQLELNWSDKNEAGYLEGLNVNLRATGPVSFYPGVTRLPAHQTTPEQWLIYAEEHISNGNEVLKCSQALRKRCGDALDQSASRLKMQAEEVDRSFENNIAETERALQAAQVELENVLKEISACEAQPGKLSNCLRQTDLNLKLSQTRLKNRAARPNAENTRDDIQFSLINEVSALNACGDNLKREIQVAEGSIAALYHSRALLEQNIAVKRKSLYVDRERCYSHRSKYPSSLQLAGF